MAIENQTRQIVVGRTADRYYVGFSRPLTPTEFRSLPAPDGQPNDERIFAPPYTWERDGSMTLGFDAHLPDGGILDAARFVHYVSDVAAHLGDTTLVDTVIHPVGTESMFDPYPLAS